MPIAESTSGDKVASVLAHVNRALVYLVVTITAVLLVATISPRFMTCDEPWVFFLLGAAAGAVMAVIGYAIGYAPDLPIPGWLLLLAGMVAGNLAVFLLARVALPSVNLSNAGIVMLTLLATVFGWVVYLVMDGADADAST